MTDVHADVPDADRIPEFPPGFRWGCATSAFQVEGALTAGGRGPSIWDDFMRTPGRILDGSTADITADSYHRHREDVAELAQLGVTDYRFSVAWPRVQPAGRGGAHGRGLDYYDRLVDDLLDAGIAPVVTLFHWDLPASLELAGGWMSRDTAYRFAEYAGIVAECLGDRVPRWITLNEPAMMTLLGYALGTHAPGRTLLFDALPTAHHQLLGHGLAVPAIRNHTDGEVGIANNHTLVVPATDSAPDQHAATGYDLIYNRIFADPLLSGTYPSLDAVGLEAMPGVAEGDLATISVPLDFYGVNFYYPSRIAAAREGSRAAAMGIPFDDVGFDDVATTGFGWPIMPEAFTELLTTLAQTYGSHLPPVVITENGCSARDVVADDGAVHDPLRIGYLAGHLRAVHAAMAAGVDIRGFYVWSLMDNFEWDAGFTQRFGLVHLDLATGTRTVKDSFRWFAGIIARNRT